MKVVPEKYRLLDHPTLGSDSSYGNNGFFVIPHYKIADYFFQCMVSDGMGWEHVSVSLIKTIKTKKRHNNRFGGIISKGTVFQHTMITSENVPVERCPTWEEMCWIKDQFWNDDECVIQYHPVKEDYVSQHHYCLHLWKPVAAQLPTPNPLMVGLK